MAFAGREPELSRLLGALSGDTRLVLVTGDAGVGKTRLVGEGLARAAAAGMVVVRGSACRWPVPCRCCRSRPRWVSWPGWMVAVCWRRRWVVRRGLCGGEVGRLLPALGLDDGPGAAGRGEGWQRERLFAAVAELLAVVAACSGSGVGLVVEDVHWADSATLDFLTYLSRPSGGGGACAGDLPR